MAAEVSYRGNTQIGLNLNEPMYKPPRTAMRRHSANVPKSRYVPSLYQNPDEEISRKLRKFLRKPPLNSAEYFEYLHKRRSMSVFSIDRATTPRILRPLSGMAAGDKIHERLKHLMPERRSIQDMILPPITDGCKENFNNLYKSPDPGPTDAQGLEPNDQLRYCQYIRHRPEFKRKTAWK